MNQKQIMDQAEQFVLHTYNRFPVSIDRGEGVRAVDSDGGSYLDFMAGIGVFGLSRALYAVVSVYVTTKVSDYIVDGMHFSKVMIIISSEYAEISRRILQEVKRGVTGIPARGMYSNSELQMIYCVVSKREITLVKDIVEECDPRAFSTISDVREVLGEGFTREG